METAEATALGSKSSSRPYPSSNPRILNPLKIVAANVGCLIVRSIHPPEGEPYVSRKKNMLRCFAFAICLVGCAHQGGTVIYDGHPAYPVTTIRLQDGKTLVHRAGPECNTSERPIVGGGDGERTYSKYTLLDRNGDQLVDGPSFLSDPTGAGEFASYYKDNDHVRVLASSTGNTVLAMEDRSPTFPRRAYILFQANDEKWTSREIHVETLKPAPDDAPPYPQFPEIINLTDQQIELKAGQDHKTVPIKVIKN